MSTDLIPVDTTYRPQMTTAEAIEVYREMREFVAAILAEGRDFGIIPGTNKPTLLKAGAEKLCRFFGLSAGFTLVGKIENWTATETEPPLFNFVYRCSLSKNGIIVAECDGASNTWENRYKHQRYQPYSIINTVMKQAQKRAFVGAVLLACNASEYFTQDLDEMGPPNEGGYEKQQPGDITNALKYLNDQGVSEMDVIEAWGSLPTADEIGLLRRACAYARDLKGTASMKAKLIESLNTFGSKSKEENHND